MAGRWIAAIPHRKVIVEAVGPGGEVLGSGPANHFRGDLLGAGLADGLCAFKIDISAHYERLIGQEIAVRFAGTNVLMQGSPIRILPNSNMQRFLKRRDVLAGKPGVLPRLRRALTHPRRHAGRVHHHAGVQHAARLAVRGAGERAASILRCVGTDLHR